MWFRRPFCRAHGRMILFRELQVIYLERVHSSRVGSRYWEVPLALLGRTRGLPLLPLLGLLATSAIWIAVIVTHELGRELGIVWVVMGMGLYIYFRRKNRLPLRGRDPPEPREVSSPRKGERPILSP